MNVIDERELTRGTRKGTKYYSMQRRLQHNVQSKSIRRPNLKRSSSLPSKLETAAPETRKLFWFRPESPKQVDMSGQNMWRPEEYIRLAPCVEFLADVDDGEEELLGLKFL